MTDSGKGYRKFHPLVFRCSFLGFVVKGINMSQNIVSFALTDQEIKELNKTSQEIGISRSAYLKICYNIARRTKSFSEVMAAIAAIEYREED